MTPAFESIYEDAFARQLGAPAIRPERPGSTRPRDPRLQQRCDNRSTPRARLTRAEVKRIRAWAKSDGFGLDVQEQVRALQALPQYDTLHVNTLRDVLRGDAWADPTYDRTVPLTSASPSSAVNPFVMFLLVMWLTFKHRSCLVTVLPGIFPGYHDAQAE